MNENNLIPQSERTKDEQREIARMGGIASGIARRERANMKRWAETFYNTKTPQFVIDDLEKFGFDFDASTLGGAYFAKLWEMFLIHGNLRAAELIFKIYTNETLQKEDEVQRNYGSLEMAQEEAAAYIREIMEKM